jgi:lipopolysaccharide export system protein LptC
VSEPADQGGVAPAASVAAGTNDRGGRLRRALIMAVLGLGAAGVALFIMDRRGAPSLSLDTPLLEGAPEFYMEGAEVRQFRLDGTLEYRLASADVRHFQQQAMTRLAAPDLTLLHPARPPWQASAETGVLRRPPQGAPEEVVELSGAVRLEQTRPDGDYVRLETSRLELFPRRQYAQTDRDVMIESLAGRTTAAGLEGDLQLGLLTFHSADGDRVRTVLQPQQFK